MPIIKKTLNVLVEPTRFWDKIIFCVWNFDSENCPTVDSLLKLNILNVFIKKGISTYQDGLNRIKNASQLNDRADLLLHPSSDKAFYIFVTHNLKLTGLNANFFIRLCHMATKFFENFGSDIDTNFRGINEVKVLWFSLKIFLEILYSWYWFWHIQCSHSNFWWHINLKNYYLIMLTVSSWPSVVS